MARKLPKKPKQPKMSSSQSTWERYYERVKAWDKKVTAIKNAPKVKARLKAAADKLKSKAR